MKAVVAVFNQDKALVGAFSVITNLGWTRHQANHHQGSGVNMDVEFSVCTLCVGEHNIRDLCETD